MIVAKEAGMMRRKVLLVLLLLVGTAACWAYEPSLPNMTVPSTLGQGDLDALFVHRFLGSAFDNPLETLLGLTIGANVGFGARYMIVPGLQARAYYFTDGQEVSGGLGYGRWFADSTIGVQADALVFSPVDATGRQIGVFGSVTAQAALFSYMLRLDLEAGYDSFLNHIGVGIGARFDIIPGLTVYAELYPFIPQGWELHPEQMGTTTAYVLGVMITTFGHQFSLLAGNSFALGERRLMAGAPPTNGLYLGFNIQRKFP
jgi:hypothetical protein